MIISGAALLYSAAGQAQVAGSAINTLSDSSFSNTTGNTAVNTSAGIGNLQVNMAALGAGDKNVSALISNNQKQAEMYYANGNTTSRIDSGAMSNVSGIVAVNQVSGNGNMQANLIAIAVGGTAEVSNEQLGHIGAGATRSDAAENGAGIKKINSVILADSAVSNASGIVQISQIAGSGNITANIFTLGGGGMQP